MGDGRRRDDDDVAYRTTPGSRTRSALGLPSEDASAAPAGAGEEPDAREDTIQQASAVTSLGQQLAQHLAAAVAGADVDPCADSAAGLVRMAGASFRLEGWALWSQLATIAALLTRWRARPPSPANESDAGRSATGAPSTDDDAGVEDPDGDIRERADATWDAAVRRARLRMPTPADMVEECVAAEVALACGLSQSRAADRVLAADLVLLDGKLPRTARLLQAGLLDWPKIQLLTHRLGVGTDAVLARLVERTLIPDEDLAMIDALEAGLDDRVDAAPLPQVTRMTLPGLAAAIEATIAALDAEAAAERAKAARDRRCVSTRMDPDGMGRLEAAPARNTWPRCGVP